MGEKDLQQRFDELQAKYDELLDHQEILQVALGLTNHVVTFVDLKAHSLMHIHHEGNYNGITTAMEDVPESIINSGIIHPDSIDGYRVFFQKMYSGEPHGEYTLRSWENDKGWIWFNIIFKTIYDKDGTPLRAICFSDDITVKKKAELQYQQYKSVVTADADLVWEINLSKDLLLSVDDKMDTVVGTITEATYTELVRLGLSGITDYDERVEASDTFSAESLISCFNNAHREVSMSYNYDYHDGSGVHFMTATAYMMTDANEDIICILCSRDITKTKEAMEALEQKADTDALTRLYNRSGFNHKIKSVLKSFPNSNHGYIIFDIDHFKSANDNFGHSYGDEILKLVADTMRSTFRQSDVLCRLGGDEFVVFMQNVDNIHAVRSKANILRENLKRLTKEKNLKFHITISAGAIVSNPDESLGEIYQRADKLLYASKESGKDKVTCA